MYRDKYAAGPDDKKSRKGFQSKNKPELNNMSQKGEQPPNHDGANSFFDFKMEVGRPLLDYMSYLEQLIQDTKAQADRQRHIVSNLILNMALQFGLKNVTMSSIEECKICSLCIDLDTVVVEGKELQFQQSPAKVDWFEMLQNQRLECFVSDSAKDNEKKEPNTYRQNLVSDQYVVPKRKYNKKNQDMDVGPRKKRKYNGKDDKSDGYAPMPSEQPMEDAKPATDNDYKALLANILQQNGSNVNMAMIGGFEKYISPDLKLTPNDKKDERREEKKDEKK